MVLGGNGAEDDAEYVVDPANPSIRYKKGRRWSEAAGIAANPIVGEDAQENNQDSEYVVDPANPLENDCDTLLTNDAIFKRITELNILLVDDFVETD